MANRSQSDEFAQRERARALLAAYGADPARWPGEEAALYESLRDDQAFKAASEDAAALDALLAAAPNESATGELKDRILAAFPATRRGRDLLLIPALAWLLGARRLVPAGAALGLSALGFIMGAASAGSVSAEIDPIYYALDTSILAIEEGSAFWAE